ncbi:MAG TPA: dihydroorotate dehydrogenase-like protein [bacterium]|nr:dihydroorotate dehydrogenase-like protein [bacterium]
MDLSTRYLGLQLPHPFVAGASPLADDLDTVRRLEDAGAAAIVLRSLFEEQITNEQLAAHHAMDWTGESFPEATSFIPDPHEFALGPEEYLEHIRKVREATDLRVFASLNGTTPGGWLDYAELMEEAGAHALELNVYQVATDPGRSAADLEADILSMVHTVGQAVDIPVAVKLSPFHTAMAHFARQLDQAGAKGLVLFNRFYQPDIDTDELDVVPALHLSDSTELLLRLRWLAILSGRVVASLAVTGGVHTPIDAIKAIMAGAHTVQMVSALLRNGPDHLRTVQEGVRRWLIEREYESLEQMQGSMGLLRCPDPKAFERGNYMRILQGWRGLV